MVSYQMAPCQLSDENRQAGRIAIQVKPVKVHVNALCTKLGAANRAEAVAIALRKHLLKT